MALVFAFCGLYGVDQELMCACVCVQGGERSGQLSYEQVAALRDVKDLTVAERHARDVGASVSVL